MSKEEIAVHFVTELIRTGALGLPKSVVNAYHEILEGLSEKENSDEEEFDKLPDGVKIVYISTGERGTILNSWYSSTSNEMVYEIVWEDPEDVEYWTHTSLVESIDIRAV